ncbi:MAG: L-histidine N(alpha)-methyltransferase [Balneolaceae bacterium]
MIQEVDSALSEMKEEILQGLQNEQKVIPSKYLYDTKGSELFEEITHLQEYYPTRTEISILQNNMQEIVNMVGSNVLLAELGSGSSRKTRMLLDNLSRPAAYVPIDISSEYLTHVVSQLQDDYSGLEVLPLCADYTKPFHLPNTSSTYNRTVLFYPGSTIGNFIPEKAHTFLGSLSRQLESGDGFLIGIDLKKDKKVLEKAYNDSQGTTARFNKNILRHINKKLCANFSLANFQHRAFYNTSVGRIEMHLVSTTHQEVTISGERITILKGESIHTENSYKYSLDEFYKLIQPYFSIKKNWLDPKRYFAVLLLEK